MVKVAEDTLFYEKKLKQNKWIIYPTYTNPIKDTNIILSSEKEEKQNKTKQRHRKEETISAFNILINFLNIQNRELSKCEKNVF